MTASDCALVLIGPMGAGKTSIGRRVAKALGLSFFDTDSAIVREHGPIETIFAEHGEPYFRALEREAVREGLATGGVVSLGGGAVLDPETRHALAAHRVVQLTVEPRVVAGRIRNTSRPLLQSDDALTRWVEIMEARRPLYDEVCNVTIDTSHGPMQAIVAAVVEWANTERAKATTTEEQ